MVQETPWNSKWKLQLSQENFSKLGLLLKMAKLSGQKYIA
jgi:hypothetical protein